MTLAIARFVQANPYLFSAERRAEADSVAGVRRSLNRIMRTKNVPGVLGRRTRKDKTRQDKSRFLEKL